MTKLQISGVTSLYGYSISTCNSVNCSKFSELNIFLRKQTVAQWPTLYALIQKKIAMGRVFGHMRAARGRIVLLLCAVHPTSSVCAVCTTIGRSCWTARRSRFNKPPHPFAPARDAPICCYHKVARIRGENVYLLYTIYSYSKKSAHSHFYER